MRELSMRMIWVAAAVAVGTAAAAETPKSQDDERRVCRRIDGATGSRLGARRVCRTAAEWRAMEEEEQRAFRAARSARPSILRRA
jgi:hypothetical protein